jgi:flagellar biosynthesis GTPase FlhF
MENRSHMISRIKGLFLAFVTIGLIGFAGCHDWPDERATAIEAQTILRELNRIDKVADANIPIPAVYKQPPRKVKQIVGGAEEWKLFYFCQYHTAEEMKTIIEEQFSSVIFDAKGKSQTLPNFGITANPGTNQIIARCPAEADVDAILEVIREADIPPVQVRIDCMVSEMYADLTVDRETSMLIQNLFGEGVRLGGDPDNENLAFPGAALRDPAREKFGLKIGIARGEEGHRFEALVDILVSRGYLKILMNPTLEVVNGQTARIQSKQHVPLQQVTVQSGGFGGTPVLRTQTEYYDIIDSLDITPHVYADGYIGLQTQAQIAAYLTPEGIKQLPIVTERTITNKDNRIRHGDSLIIGGIRKTEKRDVIRGVPVLKDIPGLNLLFSGRDFEERATEVIFIITPTISTGGKPNEDIVEMLREKHSSPMTQGLHEAVMDPLGIRAREEEQERKLDEARDARLESEAEKTRERLKAMETSEQIEGLQSEIEQTKAQVQEASTKAEQAASKAEEAKSEAHKAASDAKQAKTEAEKAQARANETQQESEPQEEAAEQEEPSREPPKQESEQPRQEAEPAN